MSALTTGVQYSLSSNQNNGLMPKQRTGKNKTLFFVKLTDSCLKAVEDYLRCCQQVRRSTVADLFAIYATIIFVGDHFRSLLVGALRPLARRLRDFSCARPARLVFLRPRPHIHSTSVFRFFSEDDKLAPLAPSTCQYIPTSASPNFSSPTTDSTTLIGRLLLDFEIEIQPPAHNYSFYPIISSVPVHFSNPQNWTRNMSNSVFTEASSSVNHFSAYIVFQTVVSNSWFSILSTYLWCLLVSSVFHGF